MQGFLALLQMRSDSGCRRRSTTRTRSCSSPVGWNDRAPALRQSDRELLESLQHPTALAANGCPAVIAGVCCHQDVREIRLPQFTRGNG
jgi:hypothetical protein